MSTTADLDRWIATARALAAKAHAGQRRRNGTPYLTHPAMVAASVPGPLQPIAWLHDVVEDSTMTLDDLRGAGLPERVVSAVGMLTKFEGEEYEVYLARVSSNPEAAAVKCADLYHNLSDRPKPETRDRYQGALPRLLDAAKPAWPSVSEALEAQYPGLIQGMGSSKSG